MASSSPYSGGPPGQNSAHSSATNDERLSGNQEYAAARECVLGIDENDLIVSNFAPASTIAVGSRSFLLAMLRYAPPNGVSYVVRTICESSNGGLSELGSQWFWGFTFSLVVAQRQSESISNDSSNDTPTLEWQVFFRELYRFENYRPSTLRLYAGDDEMSEVEGRATHILPSIPLASAEKLPTEFGCTGTVVRFTDARYPDTDIDTDNESPGVTSDLPNPKYLALHAAIAGVVHTSGASEVIEKMWTDAEVSGFANDGSTSSTELYLAFVKAGLSA